MKSTNITIGEIEKKMFEDYILLPSKEYECSVLMDGHPDSRLTMMFDFSTDESCEIINVKTRIPMPFEELNFWGIEEIKDREGNIAEKIEQPQSAQLLLHEACAVGDPNEVKQLLAANPDVNAKFGSSGFSPLHTCVAGTDGSNRQTIIELLYQAGANLESKDDEIGLTALHFTAIRNKPLCATTLIKCGANTNATEANGATALHGAAFQGNFEVTEVLLNAGANPSVKDKHNNTPMSLALRGNHYDLLDLLKEYD